MTELETLNISEILICDDHPFIQAGLEMTLRDHFPSQVRIHKTLTGQTALAVAQNHELDFAIIDLELPDLSGLDVIKKIQELSREIKILVLTNCNNPSVLRQIQALQVTAICHKSSPQEQFTKIVEKALAGRTTVLDSVTHRMLEESQHLHFTPKELEVLEKIALGYSNQKIADELGCALTTVRFHRANILQKGGFRNAAEVTAWFLKGKNQPDRGS